MLVPLKPFTSYDKSKKLFDQDYNSSELKIS